MQPFHSPSDPPPPDAATPVADAFVDALFEKLDTERRKGLAQAAMASQSRERVAAAAATWWQEFCQVLEHKIGAWNAKGAPDAHVNCTRTPSGSIQLWHRSVEAELSLRDMRIAMTGRIGKMQPRESPFVEFTEARSHVGAILSGDGGAKSPAEAADHLLAPILTHAFAGSAD